MKNQTLAWVILITDNFDASLAFYRDLLKLKIIRLVPQELFVQFQLKNCFLALYGRKKMENLIGKDYIKASGGGAVYTFQEVDKIDKFYQELKNQGITFIQSPKTQPWGQRTAYFSDPDGHIWEIQQWLNK